MSARLRRTLAALAACIGAGAAAQPRSSAPATAPLFEVRRVEVPAGAAAPLPVDVISFAPGRAELRVLPPAAIDPGMADGGRGLSVRAAVAPLMRRLPPAAASELLIVNGGFSGSRTDLPVGLLVSDGRVASTVDRQLRRGNPDDTCVARRADRLRYAALLCAAPGKLRIEPARLEADLGACRNALQSAPLLVEGGQAAICPDETATRPYLRSALCRSEAAVHVVITAAAAHLYPLAVWMATPAAKGGLGCHEAMNLSGDSSSGAVLLSARRSANPQRRDFGDGHFPLPSLIVVQPLGEPGRSHR